MTEYTIPPRLRSGDLIGLISPSSPVKDEARIMRGLSYFMDKGYYVRVGWSVGAKDGYLAGPDYWRARDIHDMFEDTRVGAIIATRGGYGSARLLDQLDFDMIAKNPKIVIGFSDITALSLALLARTGLITFAGPMLAAEFAEDLDAATEKMFWEILTHRRPARILASGNETIMRPGRAEGRLIGGNLAVLCSLIGSNYLPDFKGSILFLEDVGENVYKIDRMLLQLKYAGILGSVAGIVLGRFTAIPEDAPNRDLDEVLREYLLPLNVPILADYPFGHIPNKLILPIGAQVRIDSDGVPLTLLQSVIE